MSLSFNADEVFEMAEEIERNGRSFYETMAERLGPGHSQELLGALAREEAEHVRIFSELRRRHAEAGDGVRGPEPDAVTVLYLRALADGRVFEEPAKDKDLGACPSPEAVLRFAIQREKDSIVYYMGMKEVVPPELGREAVDAIIREEMDHVTRLSNELLTMGKDD